MFYRKCCMRLYYRFLHFQQNFKCFCFSRNKQKTFCIFSHLCLKVTGEIPAVKANQFLLSKTTTTKFLNSYYTTTIWQQIYFLYFRKCNTFLKKIYLHCTYTKQFVKYVIAAINIFPHRTLVVFLS